MALTTRVINEVQTSDALGGGSRVARATIVVTWNGTDPATAVISPALVPNMTPAELTDFQAFINGLDEVATALIAGIETAGGEE